MGIFRDDKLPEARSVNTITLTRDQVVRFNGEFEDCLQLLESLMGMDRTQINTIQISKALEQVAKDRPEDLRFIKSHRLKEAVLRLYAFMAAAEQSEEREG